MRCRCVIRVLAAVAAAVSLVVGTGSVALGKEGVKARLTTPLPLDASPGETVAVAWTLSDVDEQGVQRPFNAIGVFVRLHSAAGGAATMAFATADAHPLGRYDARVTVPNGGIGGVEIGLRGTTDVVFPVENDPFAVRAAAPVARTTEATSGRSLPTLLALISGLVILPMAAVLWFLARRARWRGTRLPAS
jgi:hypothetical protein